jgi:hypothetical protein
MWLHVYGFQNCKYHLEWPLVTCNPWRPSILPYFKSPKNSILDLQKILKLAPQKSLFQTLGPQKNYIPALKKNPISDTPKILFKLQFKIFLDWKQPYCIPKFQTLGTVIQSTRKTLNMNPSNFLKVHHILGLGCRCFDTPISIVPSLHWFKIYNKQKI